jgi:hypothetical protein
VLTTNRVIIIIIIMIRTFNKMQYYGNMKCDCWKTNCSQNVSEIIMIIIIISKYLEFEVITKERIRFGIMRHSA